MKKFVKYGIFALLSVFVLTGCRTAAIYNVSNNPVETEKKVSDEQVYGAIKRAGVGLGWIVKKVKPGLAEAKLNLRKHMALVEIPYGKDGYSINYKKSINLNYDREKGLIHSNYNGWIQNFDNAIQVELSGL